MKIRLERPSDMDQIRALILNAFAEENQAGETEAGIVDRLRASGAMTLSVIAETSGNIVAHAAFSKVLIGSADLAWYGLGPVCVHPDCQSEGLGTAVVTDGLFRLRTAGAAGCVVLGEPAYYQRFGFRAEPQLFLEGVPPEYFQSIVFDGQFPAGPVSYDPAFNI